MSRRKKSTLIVLCWILMMVVGNIICFIPNGDGFVYIVYVIALLNMGNTLELWMEKILNY